MRQEILIKYLGRIFLLKIRRKGGFLMPRPYVRLTYDDRKKIETLYKNNIPVSDIARILKIGRSTIYRELKRGNDGKNGYSAEISQMNL